jgi:hypothetical protein
MHFPCIFTARSIFFALVPFFQAKNPHAVQPHLRKCFNAIEELEFGGFLSREQEGVEPEDGKGGQEDDTQVAAPEIKKTMNFRTSDITAMISAEGERVGLVQVSSELIPYFTGYQLNFL